MALYRFLFGSCKVYWDWIAEKTNWLFQKQTIHEIDLLMNPTSFLSVIFKRGCYYQYKQIWYRIEVDATWFRPNETRSYLKSSFVFSSARNIHWFTCQPLLIIKSISSHNPMLSDNAKKVEVIYLPQLKNWFIFDKEDWIRGVFHLSQTCPVRSLHLYSLPVAHCLYNCNSHFQIKVQAP